MSGIDWAIIWGESGHRYRPVEKEGVQGLIEQCKRQNVKVFFKQRGGLRPKSGERAINGRICSEYPKLKPAVSKKQSIKIDAAENGSTRFKKTEFERLIRPVLIR